MQKYNIWTVVHICLHSPDDDCMQSKHAVNNKKENKKLHTFIVCLWDTCYVAYERHKQDAVQ
jgi:hypothetical protein